MAEEIRVNAEPTGIHAPVASDPTRPEWLPEKFATVEDMAKAYGELEQKQGSKADVPPINGDEQKPAEKTADAPAENFLVGGVDVTDFSKEFAEKGALSEQSYSALEEKGFPKEVVDAYIAGVKGDAQAGAELQEREIASVKEVAGGPEQFTKITSWASRNLTPEEAATYNSMVNTNVSQAKVAVEWLRAKFEAAEGSEPKLVHGAAPNVAGDVYRSRAELTADIKNPKYKSDPAFQADVAKKLSRSKVF